MANKRKARRNDLKRLFILDTNVLMHDPTSLFRFMEHDVFLPMVVLEELDNSKKGLTEKARNVRQTNRYLDSLLGQSNHDDIFAGIPLKAPWHHDSDLPHPTGRLFFQTEEAPMVLPETLPGNKPDNSILSTALAWHAKHPDTQVTIVSKDINLRIKASVLGIHAEDYYNDQVLEDMDLMYAGLIELEKNFWQDNGNRMQSWTDNGRTFYKINSDACQEWYPNCCLSDPNNDLNAIVVKADKHEAIIEYAKDYCKPKHHVFGINARNLAQNFAFNFLLNPDIDFVTIAGNAGSGKTLITLAAALHQTLIEKLYREIIVTRVTVPLGEDIGFLPGTEEEKMTPWMGALMDNLEVLGESQHNEQWDASTPEALARKKIRVRSLNFMRGRTFLNKFIIIDEAQNLTAKQMQAMITRAGPGSKIVCLGNISQIDTPYLTETTSGLTYVVQRFKDWEHSAHITLAKGERSRLAEHATEVL